MENFKIFLGSALVATLGAINASLVFQVGALIPWLIIFAWVFWSVYFRKIEDGRRRVFKWASILSFFLPVSALLYAFVFAGNVISQTSSEAEQAGAAIGSVVGGGLVVGVAVVFGFSLGIVFYLLGRK